VIFSGAVEVAQLFVPGRHARLSDFIVDSISICIGPMLIFMLKWTQRRIWT
jgi:VanZ family protein